MSNNAKEFIEKERMMSEVKEHYVMQGMSNAFELLNAERNKRRDSNNPIPADKTDFYDGKSKGFEEAMGLLHNKLKALEL